MGEISCSGMQTSTRYPLFHLGLKYQAISDEVSIPVGTLLSFFLSNLNQKPFFFFFELLCDIKT